MPPAETRRRRQITRPRPSLSCVICRRRKVRCGREQPACSNCVRIQEACQYEAANRDLSTPQVTRKSNPNPLPGNTRDLGSNPASILTGDASPEDSERAIQTTTPSITNATTPNPESDASRKRLRTSNGLTPVQEFTNSPKAVQPTSVDEEMGTGTSADNEHAALRGFDVRPSGYLSIRSGDQVRHVSNGFWGLVTGHESLCETFLGELDVVPDNMPQPHINSVGLANLLETLPPKVVCDALLHSFSIGVHPILPLIHFPSLQKDYNSFWQWCRNSDISQPDNKLLSDPTFLCILFAVLYCGAKTALPAIWMASDLERVKKEIIVEQLQRSHSASLDACQHLRYPTFSTLISSLLAHGCSRPDIEFLEDLRFLSTVVRIAQSMGLHLDGSFFGLDPVTCELRRRVWWHIVWLDVQASIVHGSQTCCGSSEELRNSRMVTNIRDEDFPLIIQHRLSRSLSASSGATSITMLLAIGRFESARFKHLLISSLRDSHILGQARLDECIGAAKSIQAKLDRLIMKIPDLGNPETGFIPSRLAKASPVTHEGYYGDDPIQPTVWSSWVRNMLTMLKTEAGILVQKPFLRRADSKTEQEQKMWSGIIQLCLTYLRSFVQLLRIDAFAPYSWFCINHLAPLQCVFLCLTYLQCNPNLENGQTLRYLVDEVIDIFCSDTAELSAGHGGEHNPALSDTTPSAKQVSLAWRMLVALRKRLDLPYGADKPMFKPAVPIRCETLPPGIALRAMSLSTGGTVTDPSTRGSEPAANGSSISHSALNGHHPQPAEPSVMHNHDEGRVGNIDKDNVLDISDLAAWSSSLTQNLDEYFHTGQDVDGLTEDINPFLNWDLNS